jgi:hypothetical protein
MRDWETREDYEGVGVYEQGSHEGACQLSSPFVAFTDIAPVLAPKLDRTAITQSRLTPTPRKALAPPLVSKLVSDLAPTLTPRPGVTDAIGPSTTMVAPVAPLPFATSIAPVPTAPSPPSIDTLLASSYSLPYLPAPAPQSPIQLLAPPAIPVVEPPAPKPAQPSVVPMMVPPALAPSVPTPAFDPVPIGPDYSVPLVAPQLSPAPPAPALTSPEYPTSSYRQYVAVPRSNGTPAAAPPPEQAPPPAQAYAPSAAMMMGPVPALAPAPAPAESKGAWWPWLAALGAGLYFLYR